MAYEQPVPVLLTSFGYLVADDDGEPALVKRYPITSGLMCYRCWQSGRNPCQHIRAVMDFHHSREDYAD